MRALLDTQIIIWALNGSPELSPKARSIVENDQHALFVSMASVWEISIKSSLNKLQIRGGFPLLEQELKRFSLTILPITFAHTVEQHRLPFHHRDPFDRLIAAQALVEGLDLVSSDEVFDQYFAGQAVRRWF